MESVQERIEKPAMEETVMWKLLDQAPSQLNDNFFDWLRGIEEALSISFGDWQPTAEETMQIEQFAHRVNVQVPEELAVYYLHAYPFDNVKEGASRWIERYRNYIEVWTKRQERKGLTAQEVKDALVSMPVLWPVDCFHAHDTVAFTTPERALAIIQIDALTANVTPVAAGLRNYFLSQAALQILAEEMDVEPDWDSLRSHPKIASFSQWPLQDPPRHYCLDA